MLFDLRGRGRRRTVQVLYLGLALLIGAGLVFFGVGAGAGGGGLLSSLTGSEGSSHSSFSAKIEKYDKLAQKEPTSPYAWEQLTLARLHEAGGGGEEYVTTSGLTTKGKELFTKIAESWDRYIALNPSKTNPELAQDMVSVYGEEGLNQPSEEVKVLQVVIPVEHGRSSQYLSKLYAELAEYAYKAKDSNTGDLASARAVALSPAEDRKRLENELAEVKKQPNGPEFTTTQNGKTIKVHKGPNGTYVGTTTAPSTPSSPGGLSGTK
jgi:hypothetical protein